MISSNRIVSLISTPWPFFDRPSIQLASLKAYLMEHLPQIRVNAHHVYLKMAEAIGYPIYQQISQRSWIAECLYAAILYPEQTDEIKRLWKRKTRTLNLLQDCNFDELTRHIQTVSDDFITHIPWDRHLLVGFSICLAQLSSSLYFMHQIKRKSPGTPIVAGGAACSGALGLHLLDRVPEIDGVISGEGERPLLHLTKALMKTDDLSRVPFFPGFISKAHVIPECDFEQIGNLDDLPIPDFSDYFETLYAMAPKDHFSPHLPMEMSRGCWWRKKGPHGDAGGCAFCNLNLQWRGYRQKSPDRVIHEMKTLVRRHRVLSVFFMDNLLPKTGIEKTFEGLSALGKDLQLRAEIRAETSRKSLMSMGRAGMDEVQVGVEALSSKLLKKLNKGTTVLDNLEIMRNCESATSPNLTGNMILHFPTSTVHDVKETLRNITFALPFKPLKPVPFWLGYGSAVWRHFEEFGIRLTGNHAFYQHLFPKTMIRKGHFMMQGYQGGIFEQRRMWKPVEKEIAAWRRFYRAMHQHPGFTPILFYRDGETFLMIYHRRLNKDPTVHRLMGRSRDIYRFCEKQRSTAEIVSKFPGFGEDRIKAFLQMMGDKRLMFSENDRHLSLAVSVR